MANGPIELPGIIVSVMENRSAYTSLCVSEVLATITDERDRLKLEMAIEWLDVLARLGEAFPA